jgi:hypothetical protein
MTDREEFTYNQTQLRTNGIGFILMGLGLMALVLFTTRWEQNAPIMVVSVVFGVPLIVFGLIDLSRRRQTGVQVTVDRDGITVAAKGPDPIPWAEVERCDFVIGGKGATWVRLTLRWGSPAAARLGTTSVRIYDRLLTQGPPGLQVAIARLAPQVPRNW